MKPGLDCSQRNTQLIRDLHVAQPLEVREKQNLPQRVRQQIQHPLNLAAQFLLLHRSIGRRNVNLHQIDETPGCAITTGTPAAAIYRSREIKRPASGSSTQVITRLVRGNRE
jgi:hypothetical protein